MNWEAVGAIAELLGTFGVITTLIYLAIQIRSNTKSIRETNTRVHTDRMIGSSRLIAEDRELADVFRRSSKNLRNLRRPQGWRQCSVFLLSKFGQRKTGSSVLSRGIAFEMLHCENGILTATSGKEKRSRTIHETIKLP